MRSRYGLVLVALLSATLAVCAGAQEAPSPEKLKAAYAYQPPATLAVKETPKEDAEHSLTHLSFSNTKGQTVTGLFMRPKAEGVYPVVLLLHGLTSDKETMTRLFGRPLAARGFASLALDADLHGERKREGARPGGPEFVSVLRGAITDYRQALDYLKTRKDVDPARVGLVGYSMGAMMGSILSGVDDRVKATVLMVGGDVTRFFAAQVAEPARAELDYSSPARYVGFISPRPVFFINGKMDNIVNEAAAKTLHDAAKEPKQILWADAGHLLPVEVATKGVEWLLEKLAAKQ